MSGATFTIGEAAERAGVSPDTLRYYERVGLIGSAPRGTNGYRYYSAALVDRVLFIRNAIRFGFSVRDLAVFIKNRDGGRPPCRAVRAEGARLLAQMDRQLAELTAARAAMAATLAMWDSRLAQTSEGAPAHLLSTPAPTPVLHRGRFTSGAAGLSRRPRRA